MFAKTPLGTASAWTNFVKINEPNASAAEKLLACLRMGDARWGLASTTIEKAHRKNPSTLINARKREIAQQTGLRPEAIPFLQGTEFGRYFYLQPCGPNDPDPGVEDHGVLIQLCMLAGLMNRTTFGARELQTDAIGPYIYLGARSFTTKKGDVGIEAFQLDIKYRHCTLQPTLSAKVMRVLSGEMVSGNLNHGPGDQGLTLSLISPDKLQKWDGRKSKLKDITFEKASIRGSRLFLLNRIAETFCAILDEAGVEYQRLVFEPSHAVTAPRVNLENISRPNRHLLIVNNTGAALSDHTKSKIADAIRFDEIQFSSVYFHDQGRPAKDRSWVGLLDANTACLVLNPGVEDGSSIVVDGVRCDRPWEAYYALAQNVVGDDDVDTYTWLKYARLYNRSDDYPVLQGIDCQVVEGEVLVPDVPPKKLPAFRRCAVELALKSYFANGSIPIDEGPVSGGFTLLHTDRMHLQLGSLKGEKLSMASVVKIRVADGVIRIISRDFYPDVSLSDLKEMTERFPCLNGNIRSDSFYVIDDEEGVFLQRFTGAIVPKIVLNTRYRSIDDALAEMEQEGGISDKGSYSRGVNWALLPFYTTPGKEAGKQWRDASYIQDRGIFVRYFVPSLQPADVSMGFSNLHDLMAYRLDQPSADGKGFRPVESGLLDIRVVKLYLSTLTAGVMRLGETSKASLLEKVARLGGMDT